MNGPNGPAGRPASAGPPPAPAPCGGELPADPARQPEGDAAASGVKEGVPGLQGGVDLDTLVKLVCLVRLLEGRESQHEEVAHLLGWVESGLAPLAGRG